MESCGCGDPQYPIKGQAFGRNDRACDVYDVTQGGASGQIWNVVLTHVTLGFLVI